jgi:conjugal transfer pilus assembly protein TraD
MSLFEHALAVLAIATGAVAAGAFFLATGLRSHALRWTWASLGLPAGWVLMHLDGLLGLGVMFASLLGCALGARWHHADIANGADHAEAAHARLGMTAALRRQSEHQRLQTQGWVSGGWLRIGRDERGLSVGIPVGYESGCHTLVVGATGSGKTVSETWIACQLIEEGHGAVVIDPKGDELLHSQLKAAAARTGAQFLEWTPEGPLAYNPYAQGSDTEVADKALAGELFTEPHYLRQAQRYLGNAVRVMHAAGVEVSPVSLAAHMDPTELEVTARKLPEAQAAQIQAYLDSLGERQRRELSGVRDRLAILAESDAHPWLAPAPERPALDIQQAVAERAVVYFRLDADRRLLLTQMLAGAIVIDLVTLVGALQRQPIPTVVVVDEFTAIAAEQVARLFARGRSAGFSLVLATQELADLKGAGDGVLREQVLANISALVAHRQSVPESAELVAAMAGTKAVWVSTQQTEDGLISSSPSGRGTRRRGHEFAIHPDRIKRLGTGQAVIVTPGTDQPPAVVRVHHPEEA